MASNSSSEYKVIADQLFSSDEDIIIKVEGGVYISSISATNKLATLGDIGVETEYEVTGGASGTQPTFTGDPLFSGTYVKMSSNLVHFQIQVDMDNITSFGSGQYYVDLPFPAKHAYQVSDGCLHDISTGREYPITGHVASGESRLYLQSIDASGNTAYNIDFTAAAPVTLDTADNFHVAGTYIADMS